MTSWTALSPTQHKKLSWHRFTDYHFAQADAFAPLLVAELAEALAFYPLAFIPADGRYQLVVIQSLEPGSNAYVDTKGEWRVSYVPSIYRSHPFRLLPSLDNPAKPLVCFDSDSPLISPGGHGTGGQPLFDTESKPAKALEQVIDFLKKRMKNQHITEKLVSALDEQQLIVPWPIKHRARGSNKEKLIQGYYQINETRLRELPPNALATLAQSGALAIAYGQLLSQARISQLTRLLEHRGDQARRSPADDLDLERFFEDGGGSLSFPS